MGDEQIREIKQLWFIGNYYFLLSQKIKNRLPKDILASSVRVITDRFSCEQAFVGDQRRVMLLTAHLGSCAIRLATIDEILGKDISRKRLHTYNTLEGKPDMTCKKLERDKQRIIHFVLRHNIGHQEPHGKRKQSHNTMEEFLGKLSVEQVFESMESVIRDIRKDIQRYC